MLRSSALYRDPLVGILARNTVVHILLRAFVRDICTPCFGTFVVDTTRNLGRVAYAPITFSSTAAVRYRYADRRGARYSTNARVAGQAHQARACRGADFRRIVDDFNQHQLGSALTHSRSHMGSGQLVNQEIGCRRNEVDKPLLFGSSRSRVILFLPAFRN